MVWPLLGLGLVASLDAWFVAANPTLRESDVAAADAGRARAPQEVVERRGTLLACGALGLINLTLIGIWAAAGGGYFWPAWPLLGSAVIAAQRMVRLRRLDSL